MTTTRSSSQLARTGVVPIAPRVARCWPGALAALLVALASWAGAVEVARDAGAPAPLPVSQTLRALARLLRGKAGGEEQLRIARVATVLLGIIAVALGITFKGQNVAFMVSLAFAIAASGNFPALALAIFWRRATTSGLLWSMIVGTVSTVALIYFSPTIQVDVLGHASAWFPLKNPAILTIPLSFLVGVVVSLATQAGAQEEISRFPERERQMMQGARADG